MKYLESKQHYEDRYDLGTIEECLERWKMVDEVSDKLRLKPELKKYPKSEHERNMGIFRGRMLFVIKGLRYKNRALTIAEWMEKDRVRQDKQDNTPPPKIDCPDCNTEMITDDFRHLEDWPEDQPMRVLFILNCPKCKKRLGAYDDGEIHVSKSDFCPKCKSELKAKSDKKGKVITTIYSCKQCDYSKKDIYDLKKSDKEHKIWEEEQQIKEKKDKELLEKYRSEFCLSDKEGQEYVDSLNALEVAQEVKAEVLAEMDTPAHEKLLFVNKISITDLEILINKALIDSGFTKLSFSSPDIDRYVMVPFTVQDSKPKKRDRESIADLHTLLKTTLKDTNWRAPKDAFSYRLGFISGKLKGYESEEDLLKLFGKEEPKKPKSKLDPEFRAKYEHHNLVQLAKMGAEYEAKKSIRTRRLKNQPDGFYLNDGGRSYRCGICGGSHDGEDIWWRPDGFRCRNCWRNIQEGVIPMFDLDKERWEKEFFGKYEVTSKRGVHPSSVKRLRREGVLVGRDLKDSNGHVYETVYLVNENKKFLKDYQVKESAIKMNVVDSKGNKIEL